MTNPESINGGNDEQIETFSDSDGGQPETPEDRLIDQNLHNELMAAQSMGEIKAGDAEAAEMLAKLHDEATGIELD